MAFLLINCLMLTGTPLCAAADDGIVAGKHNSLRFGVQVSEIGNLDPHFAAASQERAVADMLFSGLLRYKPGKAPEIEPDLAADIPTFQITEGRQVWTFKLRKGVKFHAGSKTPTYELTAEDVVFSLKKSSDSKLCAYAGEYAGMKFEAADKYTVRIICPHPISTILFLPKFTNYAGGFIVSKKAIEKMGYDGFKRHPIGTGPFSFDNYKAGKRLHLKANKNYFRGRPLLAGVDILCMPDLKTREQAIIKGDVDVIMASGAKGWIEEMEKTKGIIVDTLGVGEVVTLYINTQTAPFDDIRVRRAVAYTIDRSVFLKDSSRRITGPVFSPVPAQFLPGGIDQNEAEKLGLSYPVNLSKARQLLAQAGYPKGFSVDLISSEKRLYRQNYELLKSQLHKVGIRCHLTIASHSDMHTAIRKKPQALVLYTAWRPNADAYLSRFFHSDAIVVTGAKPDTNFSHYNKVDKLIEAARMEIDPEKQINLWIQAQIKILDDMAAYPIMYTKQCYVRRETVDYGHPLISTMALYPQFTEKTKIRN